MTKYGAYYDDDFGLTVAVPKPLLRHRVRVFLYFFRLEVAARLARK